MHLSFSAVELYFKCPYAFKLKQIDKISCDGSIYTVFGKACHKTLELSLLNKNYNFDEFVHHFNDELKLLSASPDEHNLQDEESLKIQEEMIKCGPRLCRETVEALYEKFPKFELVSVEEKFNEPILSYEANDYDFKGVIDLIIRIKDENNKDIIVILDYKSCSWGWDAKKKNDKWKTYQLTYYKHFYSLTKEIEPSDIKAFFVLIKRTAIKDNIEFVEVPIGRIKTKNALKVLNDAAYNIDHKIFIKNKISCRFCDFFKTKHCNAK